MGILPLVCKRLLSLGSSRQLDSEQGGLQWGDGVALFVHEILCRDRICGSWWNKSLNKKEWAPVGNGKQLSRREACTHVCWLFTLGCYTTHGCIPALTVGSPDLDPHFHAWLKQMFIWEHRILCSLDILRLELFLCYVRGCISLSFSLTARGPSEVVTRIPHPISVSKRLTELLFSRRQRVCRNQNSWKIESFICKTNNVEEIKHSGELSCPFKNQYEAFHLSPNLFLVIILHILCLPLLSTYRQRYNVPHTCILTRAHILHWNHHSHRNMTEISICITVIICLELQRVPLFFSLNILFFLPRTYETHHDARWT